MSVLPTDCALSSTECKGLSTYDYILIQREKEEAAKNAPPPVPLYRRLLARLRKNQIVPSASQLTDDPRSMEEGRLSPTPSDRRSSSASNVSPGSLGMANFGRTPPSVSLRVVCKVNLSVCSGVVPCEAWACMFPNLLILL